MDNDMIVQYINGVEPDFSYGTSDGMSRAMVESVENMAMINDYITESTYEVITEAKSDKPGFWGKLGNKISYYFALFMKLVNKFITKIKGFFMMVKRKLTVAFAKAIKAVASFLRNRINNNRKKFDMVEKDDEVKKYKWNAEAVGFLASICGGGIFTKLHEELIRDVNGNINYKATAKYVDSNTTADDKYNSYDLIKELFANINEELNEIIITDGNDTNNSQHKPLLEEETVTFNPNDSVSFMREEFTKNVTRYVDRVYNDVQKGTKHLIKFLNELEKLTRKQFKKAVNKDDDTFTTAKNYFKATNYYINQVHLMKYRASSKMASACFKYYKKLFSAVRKVFGGFNIFGKSGDVEDKDEKNSAVEKTTALARIM